MKIKGILLSLVIVFMGYDLFSQGISDKIRLNQIGFYPGQEKVAVILGEGNTSFSLKDISSGKTVFSGKLGDIKSSPYSGKKGRIADFSAFTKSGKYEILVDGVGKSAPFEISKNIHQNVAAGALKGFYYQRASTELPEKYAGKWARKSGHADDHILIHASAVSDSRKENSIISSSRGWYDAGDYNKYIVNSGITMGTLMSFYEDFPEMSKTLKTDIPESNNALPDILDEVLWNLRWMASMQDPADGGVYHKLTNARFDGMIMPDECKQPRYVVQKGTAATLDFAAVMAQAARVYSKYQKQLPGLADSCRIAAERAWLWAEKNPDVKYNQEKLNIAFDPDIVTGAYGDGQLSDEWFWAAAELFQTTGKEAYNQVLKKDEVVIQIPTWSQVKTLGYYTILRFQSKSERGKAIATKLTAYADQLLKGSENQLYKTVIGGNIKDYSWGSSSVAANQGILLINAFKLTGQKKYLTAALGNLDYLLGRNATGFCFLTGFGSKKVMHPHHRPSVADKIEDPVPGLLSGGPNPGQQDKCKSYTSTFADECFTDDDCSYASNEIAINWNAPMVYLAAAIEAVASK